MADEDGVRNLDTLAAPRSARPWGLPRWRRRGAREPLACVPEGLVVFAIGDVHGRADLLAPMLSHIRNEARGSSATTRVIGLGDYIDRGRWSREVLAQLVALQAHPAIESVLLRGNHEATLLAFLSDPTEGPMWMHFGGDATLASYGVTAPATYAAADWRGARDALCAALPARHLKLLTGLKASAAAGDYFFAHAGALPGRPLDEQQENDLLWIRDPFLLGRDVFEKVVVHGHSPANKPYSDRRRVGVDTAAYLTNNLTAVRLEGGRMSWLQAFMPFGERVIVQETASRRR